MRRLCMAAFALAAALAGAQDWRQHGPAETVTLWLADRVFDGDTRPYGPQDLDVPQEVGEALDRLGISPYSLLRNEIWARHGYVFQTEMLAWLFRQVPWYRPDPAVGLGSLSGTAARNIDWIKVWEDRWDYDRLSAWLTERPYKGDLEPYLTEEAYRIPDDVRMSVNHLGLKPAQVLEAELWARAGAKLTDPVLAKVFGACPWYLPQTADREALRKGLGQTERANLGLLARRRVLDDLEAVTYSLPAGVTWVATLGYGALFLRELTDSAGTVYHYSSSSLWDALAFDPGRLPPPQAAPAGDLVTPLVKMQIQSEPDPFQKLVLYFSHKRYAGTVDTRLLSKADYLPPTYLAAAVRTLGLEWTALLRKEIHARAGARFSDPKAGPLFQACPWYRARYSLVPSSVTRFGPGVRLTAAERANFALLEGADLWARTSRFSAEGRRMVVDLAGNWTWAEVSEEPGFRFPVLWGPGEERPSALGEVRELLSGSGLEPDSFLRNQTEEFLGGC